MKPKLCAARIVAASPPSMSIKHHAYIETPPLIFPAD